MVLLAGAFGLLLTGAIDSGPRAVSRVPGPGLSPADLRDRPAWVIDTSQPEAIGRERLARPTPQGRAAARLIPDSTPALASVLPAPSGLPRTAPASALPSDVRTAIPDGDLWAEPQGAADASLIEVQLGRLARRVMKTYWKHGHLLLPLAAWLEFAEVSHETAGRRITGRLQPSRATFIVDADSATARVGERRVAVGAVDLAVVDGELYASLQLLSALFDLPGDIDHETAALLFHDPENLPIARRLRREAARGIQAGGDGQVAPDRIYHGPPLAHSGLVLSYDVRGSSLPGSPAAYALAAGTGLAGGSAVVRIQGSSGASSRLEGSWARAWPGQRWLTQLRLGDGHMTGPRPRSSRGFSFGNAPITRALLVEDLPFTGDLPPDWSVEAYRAGHLIAFDSVDGTGRYSLTLPIQYGENPIDFVAYGPFGEVRTFNRTFRALPSMVPAGAWEYGVSAGACRSSDCDAAANLDLRHGLSPRWTVRAGVDQVWGGGRETTAHPYGGITGAPTNALGVELEGVAHLLYRAGVRLEPSTALRLTGDYISYVRSDPVSSLTPVGTREQWSLYGRLMPTRRAGRLALEAQATRTLTDAGTRSEARMGAALQLSGAVLRPYLRREQTAATAGPVGHSYAGLQVTVLPRRALGPVLSGFWLQGHVEAENARSPVSASGLIARNLGRGFRVEAGTRWERTLPGPVLTLSLVSQLDAVRSTSTVTAAPGVAETRFDQAVGGAVVWGGFGSAPIFSSEPSLERGGVGGRVFVDLNADGLWQAEEPAAPGTRLLVANQWVAADANGRYHLWGVPPWEELLVSVDTASLASPWWIPGHAAEAVTPTPNLVRRVDVPLIVGGVIEGRVLLSGPSSVALTRPIPIVVTELKRGTRTVIESFSDGSFYHLGLPPGTYAATIEDRVVRPLGLRGDSVGFELRPGASASDAGPTVTGLELLLRPAAPEESRPAR